MSKFVSSDKQKEAADLEDLAALLDGRLDEARRALVLERLDRDEEYYEIFAETARQLWEDEASAASTPGTTVDATGEAQAGESKDRETDEREEDREEEGRKADADATVTAFPAPDATSDRLRRWVPLAAVLALAALGALVWALVAGLGNATGAPEPFLDPRLVAELPPSPAPLLALPSLAAGPAGAGRGFAGDAAPEVVERAAGALALAHRLARTDAEGDDSDDAEQIRRQLITLLDGAGEDGAATAIRDVAVRNRAASTDDALERALAAHLDGDALALGTWAGAGYLAARAERPEHFAGAAHRRGLERARTLLGDDRRLEAVERGTDALVDPETAPDREAAFAELARAFAGLLTTA